jgi:hypothetical protein
LIQNLAIFNSDELRKKNKVFSLLSASIVSRTTSQVKSHHQKMMKRHKDVENIIKFMERKFLRLATAATKTLENQQQQ